MQMSKPHMDGNGKSVDSSGMEKPCGNTNHAGGNFKIFFSAEENARGNEASTSKRMSSLSKMFKIEINKPLIPLKIALFCWFAGFTALGPFVGLYLKQLGLTLREFSIIYMIAPAVQLLGPSLSGIVADKIGRSKPVLQANLLISLVAVNCILFVPRLMNVCVLQPISCTAQTYDNSSMMELCNIYRNDSHLISCTFNCSIGSSQGIISDVCFQNYISSCYVSYQKGVGNDLNFIARVLNNETVMTCTKGYYLNNNHVNNTWCVRSLVSDCNWTCTQNANATKEGVICKNSTTKNHVFILSMVVLVVYTTFASNAFRIFDVTAMSMVKTYNSDFGRQRVWAIMGVMILTPLTGYIISLVSPEGGPPRYDAAFYIFDAMVLVTIFTVWKLDVMIDPPAKGMLKKASGFIRNVDIIVFMLMVLVIGTAWGYTKIYYSWYLEDLGASSTLMGLAIAVGSLTGLPFVFTSNWFVEKFGSSNLLLFCLVGYTVWCAGYSFLTNPWWALLYQILEIPTYHLLWVTVVTYSHSIAPPGLRATVVSTAGGIHYGIGKGTGSLIGGSVMSKYGGRTAYRVVAAMCAGTAILFVLYLYCRKKCKKARNGATEE